jgi:hypothetical protein
MRPALFDQLVVCLSNTCTSPVGFPCASFDVNVKALPSAEIVSYKAFSPVTYLIPDT